MEKLNPSVRRHYRQRVPDTHFIDKRVQTLSDFLSVLSGVVGADTDFWYRGHSTSKHTLVPSALRYDTLDERNTALSLINNFKRIATMRITGVAGADAELKWIQIAQHFGLPTRLLDWTENAVVALYFACCSRPTEHGMVYVLNPATLNRIQFKTVGRPLDAHSEFQLIEPYLRLTGSPNKRGRRTIAINPAWNSERLQLQRGTFTLHGSRNFMLDALQAPGLMYVPILKTDKKQLLSDLERIGVQEMSLFPETEHICNHLKRVAKL